MLDRARRLAALQVAGAVTLLVTLIPAPAAFACSPSRSGANTMETLVLTTLHVVIETEAKSYRIGQQAELKITVTRPAHEDPVGLGVPTGEPPQSFPAENVSVGIGLQIGDVFLPGYGMTDKEGVARVKMMIESWVKPGTANARALAYSVVQDTQCLRLEEQGFAMKDRLFKTTR